ncbi:hypothetical protein CTI12_AA264070 [Artemisia annua]|uniref:Uncharacterized protein n=1 Tax=Artemisia annua TaxID=35608 RepID=A0A2U1NHX9_ARTAN|nr:hypothetical protein CTI12_AA264070 [Artemisia annua]
MEDRSGPSFDLKILVATEENKVIMAESDKEFIEVLFSFMITPIGSVVRSTSDWFSRDIGCFNNVYASIEDETMKKLFQDRRSRDILLNQRSAAELYFENIEQIPTQNGSKEFYVCDDKNCKMITYYKIGSCQRGQESNHKIAIRPSSKFFPKEEAGFFKSTARFMITDDFKVMPVSSRVNVTALNALGLYGKVEERLIKIGRDEVLKLLKRSLISRTPLSDTFLESSINKSSNQLHDMEYSLGRMNPSLNVKDYWKKKTKNIQLKLIFNKLNNMALYAVVKEDFVDLLCTFLRIPLGYIFNQFPCLSFEGCLGNLHKSIKETNISLFRSKEKKEILVNPKLAPGLRYNSNVTGIEETTILSHCSLSSLFYTNKWFMNPMKKQENQSVLDSLIKGPATFLVTDSLEVKPLSPICVKGLVDGMRIPLSDIGEQEVFLDEEKAMHLLAACVASDHALTSTFLSKEKNSNWYDVTEFSFKLPLD